MCADFHYGNFATVYVPNLRPLSKQGDVSTRRSVLKTLASNIDRLTVAFCITLLMFFAATVPTKAVDEFQHAPMILAEHDHAGPSIFSVDAVLDEHDEHDTNAPNSDAQPDEHLAGGHHHHGDSGSSLIVPVAALNAAARPSSRLHGVWHERQIPGLRSVGPERPPRSSLLNI